MKKVLIASLGMLLVVSWSFAAVSKEAVFVSDLLESLNLCQFYLDVRLDLNAEPDRLMSEVMDANNQLEQAKLPLRKYLRDDNKDIRRIAIDVAVGIDNFVGYNLKFLELARKKYRAGLIGTKDFENDLEKITEERNSAWRLIADAAVTAPTVFAQSAKSDYPTGDIPFKISWEERRALMKQLNQAFRLRLNKLDESMENEKKGREFNRVDQNDFIFAVGLIFDELSSETYEELRLKLYRYKY